MSHKKIKIKAPKKTLMYLKNTCNTLTEESDTVKNPNILLLNEKFKPKINSDLFNIDISDFIPNKKTEINYIHEEQTKNIEKKQNIEISRILSPKLIQQNEIVNNTEGNITKPVIQQPIRKPVIQQPIRKPVIQPIGKPVIQQPIRKPVIQKPIRKPVIQQPIRKPVIQQVKNPLSQKDHFEII